ncbi:MAG: hypothetical protein R3290_13795, partial [Acidimicrobiia bacterium]|nr:hypothetical protein [Acidimicrobiia bacterium]
YNFSLLECGMTEPVQVVCTREPLPMPPGEVLVAFARFAGPVADAASDDDIFIYSFVADTDGDPGNDWVPQGEFDWDFFQGADTWWQTTFSPLFEPILEVTDATDFSQKPSAARVVVSGDTIAFVIPATEFPAGLDGIGWRITSFVHDGTFQPDASGGDVLGTDPTQPLFDVPDTPPVETTIDDLEDIDLLIDALLERLAED